MLNIKTDKTIKLLGWLFLLIGLLQLLLKAKSILLTLPILFQPSAYQSVHLYLMTLLVIILLPISILCVGIGLLRFRKWGWQGAIAVSLITFTLNILSTINYVFAAYRAPNAPIPANIEGAHFDIVSMWPAYLAALGSAFMIMLLTRKSLRSHFSSSRSSKV